MGVNDMQQRYKKMSVYGKYQQKVEQNFRAK